MKYLLLILFPFIPLLVFSQDWECIKTDGDYYYVSRDSYQTIKVIRLDSAYSSQNDSIFFPCRTIRRDSSNMCYNPDMPSWIGKYIIKSGDSAYYFFNQDNDTIKIKTHSQPGQTWTCFRRGNNFYVTARIDSVKYLSFLGYSDSVKVISFTAHDSLNNTISTGVNSLKIYLSKNHGLVKILPFFVFPDIMWNMYSEDLTEYYIIGKTDTTTGITNINFHDVYNFNVGDEFYVGSFSGDGFPFSPYYENDYYCLTSVLGKAEYPIGDSIIYQIERCTKFIHDDDDTSYSTFDIYNGDWTINFNTMNNGLFDLLPDEVYFDTIDNSIYTLNASLYNNKYLSKTIPSEDYHCTYVNDTCWNPAIWDACLTASTYISGLEGPYGNCSYYGGHEDRVLLYYKKGSEVFGTPVTCSTIQHLGVDDIETNSFSVSVSPNPFSDMTSLNISSNNFRAYSLEIYNLLGRSIRVAENIHTPEYIIERGSLPSGIYFYIVSSDNKNYSGKFIIE